MKIQNISHSSPALSKYASSEISKLVLLCLQSTTNSNIIAPPSIDAQAARVGERTFRSPLWEHNMWNLTKKGWLGKTIDVCMHCCKVSLSYEALFTFCWHQENLLQGNHRCHSLRSPVFFPSTNSTQQSDWDCKEGRKLIKWSKIKQ